MAEKIETLDYYVKEALDFFESKADFGVDLPESDYTLVVGSQSGLLAGRIMYRFAGRSFSHAKEVLARSEIDAKEKILGDVTIVSASGSRQVIPIAEYALKQGLKVNAVVCKADSQLEQTFGDNIELIRVPYIPEPPTINTSTYGMMVQSITREDIAEIRRVVESLREPEGGYDQFSSFTVMFTDRMPEAAEMVDWKLRGENIGRCIGSMSTHLTNFMHGAGINDAEKELYIGIGLSEEEREVFGQVLEEVPGGRKHFVDLPEDFGPLGFLLVGYSVVGQIQKNYPGFQENIGHYGERAGGWKWL